MTARLLLSASLLCLVLSCQKKQNEGEPNQAIKQLSEGLIAYYPFNNNANDESGNAYHLSVKDAVLSSNRFGGPSKAYSFNGATAFMGVPELLKADSVRQFTISLWVKPEIQKDQTLFSFLPNGQDVLCSSSLALRKYNTSYVAWYEMATALSASTCTTHTIRDSIAIPLDKWTHLALVQRHTSNNTTFPYYQYLQYFNGNQLKVSASGSNPIATSFSHGGVIGCKNTSGDYAFNFEFFKGSIDDVRIYNRALSTDEILQLSNLRD